MKYFGEIVNDKDLVTKEYVDRYAQLSGASFTGPVTFGNSVSIDEATIGDLVINGNASFTNNIQANTINGVEVGSTPKFTDTDTKVTSSANHYMPATASGNDKTASASGATAAWNIDVVKGITINTDGKGHITGLSVTSGKIPANPNSDTWRKVQLDGTDKLGTAISTNPLNLKAGTNVSITESSGTFTFSATDTDTKVTSSANHYTPSTASGNDKTASASGATAAWSIDVVKGITINTDGKGHITGLSVTSGKIPANPNTDVKVKQLAAITTAGAYPIILAYSTATTEETNSVNKTSTLTYNPNTKALVTGGTVDGYILAAASAKSVVTSIDTSASLPTSNAVKTFVENKGYTTNTGTITQVKTTAGAHTTINVSSGAATFNVPTKTSHLTNDSGFLTSSSTLNAANLSGAIPSAVTATTQSAGNNSTKIATTAYVDGAISGLPTPMQFIGTVGTNGTKTWANLPAAAASNEGHTYKVITDHAAETGKPAAKAGDTIVSNGSSWIVIPSGDETATQSATTGISIASHGTGTITGVQSSTTSVRGVKTGTDSLATASHVKSGGNGTAPTLGTAISLIGVQSSTTSVRGVKTGTNSTTTASKVTLGTAFSIPNPSATDVTVPIRADADVTVPVAASAATTVPIKATSATTVPIRNISATAIPNVTAVGSGDASLTFAMDTTDTKKLKITFSHTHIPPTLGTAISLFGVQANTTSVIGVQSSTTSVTGVSGSTTVRGVKTGTNSTTTASKVSFGTAFSVPNVTGATDITVPIRADADTTVPIKNVSATSIPNVISAGTASTWTFEDVDVPIRADADTTVPIKNTSTSTFVTGTTHTVTDNGHTHTI